MVQSLPGFLNLCLDVCSPSQVLGDVYTEVLEAAYSLHRGPADHKSSHLYLYSAFNNTDCVKALNSIKLEDRVSVMYNNKIKHSISVKGISLLNSEMSLSS